MNDKATWTITMNLSMSEHGRSESQLAALLQLLNEGNRDA